jgi:two-component system, OmpR family, phosphate regulon response regulator PhoB
MYVVVLAREVRLAALVKERFDRRKVGLTHTIGVEDPRTVERAVQALRPSAFLLVSRYLDSIVVDVCRRLGRNPIANQSPLIVATEQATEAERIAVLEAGADSIVVPPDLDAIERRIHVSCHRWHVHPSFRGKEVSIDGDGSRVSVSGFPLTLTRLEARLLRLLIDRRNTALSRSELELIVWGRTRSRTIDVHISRLRKKLGQAGSRIETVTKVGYRYVEAAAGMSDSHTIDGAAVTRQPAVRHRESA